MEPEVSLTALRLLADVRWRVSATPTWLDPANWTPAEAPRDPKDLAATPHLERVPCGQDVAAFADSAFQTVLPDFPVRVAAVKVYDVSACTHAWGWACSSTRIGRAVGLLPRFTQVGRGRLSLQADWSRP